MQNVAFPLLFSRVTSVLPHKNESLPLEVRTDRKQAFYKNKVFLRSRYLVVKVPGLA